MSESASIIKEFLASVGFKADEKSLKLALAKVAAFGAGIKIATAGIYAGLIKVATGEAQLARTAERLGTTTDKLREMGYVAEQNGASLDAVTGSMEALLSKNPRIKDAARALELAGQRMRGMNEQQRRMYASRMGIDPTLIPALTGDVQTLKNEFRAMYEVAGVGGKEAAESSKLFLAELNKLQTLGSMLARAVSVSFLNRVSKDIEHLRKMVMENFDKIKRVMNGVINVILRLSAIVSAFVYRAVKFVSSLVSWFDKLSDAQKKTVMAVGGLIAAWKILNAGFLATPLGTIILGLTAIAGLIDDYLTYMEGGESYFNWGPWVDTIENARASIVNVISAVGTFITEHDGLLKGLAKGMALFLGLKKAIGVIGAVRGAFKLLNTTIKANPIMFVLGLMCMAAGFIIEYWDEIKAFIAWVWEFIKEIAAAVADYFISRWEEVKQVAAAVADGISACWEGLKRVAANVADYFVACWEGLKEVFATVANFFTSIWQGVKNWFLGLWTGITDAFPDFGAWASGAVDSIKSFFGRGIQWVKDKIKSLVSFLPEWVQKKLGVKTDEDEPEDPQQQDKPKPHYDPRAFSGKGSSGSFGGEADFDAALNNALALSNAPIAPGPAQAATMIQKTEQDINMKSEANFYITTSDPVAAGNQAAGKQEKLNADLVRHTRGAVK